MSTAIGEVLNRIEAAQAIDDVEDAHSFLRAVYRNPAVPLPVRMRAAIEALPYEKPSLRAQASIIVGGDFAERALERSGARKIVDQSATAEPHVPSVPDRSFRRV